MKLRDVSKPVRIALAAGNVRQANEILGFPFYLWGTVVHGNHLGKSLGFPTANIELEAGHPLLIASGVYAVFVDHSGIVYPGMANIGIRPTVDGKELKIEVNLFDFDGDLYGQTLQVFFMEWLREEKKFSGIDGLVEQIRRDKDQAKELLSRFNDPDSNT
ncbi:MAG: hypothetical protein M0Q38_00615 [Bacteroidales bacterium]|jgi:riboflavin kinase/FMN adenylyltransferase|nr:hypothetical protein [Bacteroidales bacterium]